MKCYEVLFNSSQCSRSGAAGFGIRSQSEGLSNEYIKAAQIDRKYHKGNCKGVYASELVKDTTKILDYPVNISYSKAITESGKTLYILRRCIALEFDYAYYVSGQATRPGNYMEHTLIFDEKPDASIFDIIYEKPKAGSRHFRPVNRIPSPENEELKGYMLNKSADFKVEDLTFETEWNEPVSDMAYNIFFSLIEARKEKRALVVKIDDKVKNRVIADVCRLLGYYAPEITFTYSYTDAIDTSKYNITYITQYYSAPALNQMPTFNICEASKSVQTDSADKYMKMLREAVQSNDKVSWNKIVKWLISGDYEFVANASQEASLSFYNYITTPESFTEYDLINDEVIGIIAKRHANSAEHALIHTRIEEMLRSSLEQGSVKAFVEAAKLVSKFGKSGINLIPALNNVKEECCEYILKTPEQLVEIYTSLDESVFNSYVCPEMFHQKYTHIASKPLYPHLTKLYKYFFKDKLTAGSKILATLLNKVPASQIAGLLKDANPNAEQRKECYLSMIERNTSFVTQIWAVAENDLGNSITENLMKRFGNQHANEEFAPLFYYSLKYCSADSNSIISSSAMVLAQNDTYKQLVINGDKRDKCYYRLFDTILRNISSSNANAYLKLIEKDVILPLQNCIELRQWKYLHNLLNGDAWKNERLALYLKYIYSVANRINFKEKFKEVAYERIKREERDNENLFKEILEDLHKREELNVKELLALISGSKKSKFIALLSCCFKEMETPFNEAMAIVKSLHSEEVEKSVMGKCYESKYRSHCRKEKIKAFFKKLFSRSMDEKKEKKAKPQAKGQKPKTKTNTKVKNSK